MNQFGDGFENPRPPVDYHDKYLIIAGFCNRGRGDTFRFFYRDAKFGTVCTALAVGDANQYEVGDKVYYINIKENAVAEPFEVRRFEKQQRELEKEGPDGWDPSLLDCHRV